MLIKHSIYYLGARGLPGIVSFLSLIIYTRLLSVDEYGKFALILAGFGLINVIFFQWLHLIITRFLLDKTFPDDDVLNHVAALFLVISGVILFGGFCFSIFIQRQGFDHKLWMTIFLVITLGWLELSLKLVSLRFEPATYGKILITKNVIGLVISCLLIWTGMRSDAPIIGLIIGATVSWLLFGKKNWEGVKPSLPTKNIFTEYVVYGLPLSATFALGWVISSSDRIIISFLINDGATGAYSAGYELAQQTIGLLLIVVNTAAYPLLMREYALNGQVGASRQLAANGDVVITIALVSSVGMIALAPLIVSTIIGPEFRNDALKIFPWIAVSAAISGVKAFHLDLAFQIAKDTKWQLYTYIVAAALNVVLNFILIPLIGLMGAAVSTVIAFLVASFLSWGFGRSVFPVPPMFKSIIRAGFVSVCTYLSIIFVVDFNSEDFISLVVGCFTGLVAALVSGVLVNACNIREIFLSLWIKNKSNKNLL